MTDDEFDARVRDAIRANDGGFPLTAITTVVQQVFPWICGDTPDEEIVPLEWRILESVARQYFGGKVLVFLAAPTGVDA